MRVTEQWHGLRPASRKGGEQSKQTEIMKAHYLNLNAKKSVKKAIVLCADAELGSARIVQTGQREEMSL